MALVGVEMEVSGTTPELLMARTASDLFPSTGHRVCV